MTRLAIHGGPAVREDLLPLHRPSLGEREIQYATESIGSGHVAGPGPFCERVEQHLESRWESPRALTVTSCTHALETALLALNLGERDEVLVPSFTFVSTAGAVLRAGARPVFVDVDPETLTVTPETLKPALGEQTAGVIMVHYGGYPGPVERVRPFCEEHDLPLIEDAAQAVFARRNDRPAGTFGRFGALSFHGTKTLSCGEGGLLLVNDESDVRRCETIRDKGTDRSTGNNDKYTWRTVGSSYVLSDILGAVLLAQVERADSILEERRSVQSRLRERIRRIDTGSRFRLLTPPGGTTENGHLTALLLRDDLRRDWFLKALRAEGIDARAHYRPLHRTPYARAALDPPDSLPGTEQISRSIVRLPTYAGMGEEEINTLGDALEKVYAEL